jgi:hypothetical protein
VPPAPSRERWHSDVATETGNDMTPKDRTEQDEVINQAFGALVRRDLDTHLQFIADDFLGRQYGEQGEILEETRGKDAYVEQMAPLFDLPQGAGVFAFAIDPTDVLCGPDAPWRTVIVLAHALNTDLSGIARLEHWLEVAQLLVSVRGGKIDRIRGLPDQPDSWICE